MTAPDRISTLDANRDALFELLRPYILKLDNNVPLTTIEIDRYHELKKTYDETLDEIDAAWIGMVKKPSLFKRIFHKN